jgi:cyclopropane-fatty-acyl-phospholipid synthase
MTQPALANLPTPARAFLNLLHSCITDARVRFQFQGQTYTLGQGTAEQTWAGWLEVRDARFFSRVLAYGNLGMGEAFMEHEFDARERELHEFLIILLRNQLDRKLRQDWRLLGTALWHRALATLAGKAKSVQRHYDLGDELFETFLDSSMTYSCGYAVSPDDSLEQLQHNKLERICHKLQLRPGDRLLDIGCGYGGLLIHAARHFGTRGVGVTLSRRHAERARANVARAGLSHPVRVEYGDFAGVEGEFDRVVSVGMFEHVPRAEYGLFFRTLARVLTPTGVGLLHTIGCTSEKNGHDPFIQKYIFPGSNQPRLSEITHGMERRGLAILDVENMAQHYGYTLRHWLRNFRANQGALPSRYDEAFRRMWEYYFQCGIAVAFCSDSTVYQTLFSRDSMARGPLARV